MKTPKPPRKITVEEITKITARHLLELAKEELAARVSCRCWICQPK
jgi:hypothetical protein